MNYIYASLGLFSAPVLKNTQKRLLHLCKTLEKSRGRSGTRLSELKPEDSKSNFIKQARIFNKLMMKGNSKKHIPCVTSGSPSIDTPESSSMFNLGQTHSKTQQRRKNMLNKLFLDHITDMMAVDNLKEPLTGYGIEVTKVEISKDFNNVKVFWLVPDKTNTEIVRQKLNASAGEIRSNLISLNVMGKMPFIFFVEDMEYAKLTQLEQALEKADFGPDFERVPTITPYYDSMAVNNSIRVKTKIDFEVLRLNQQLKGISGPSVTEYPDDMRHDVFGLNHKEMMDMVIIRTKKRIIALDKLRNEKEFKTNVSEDNTETLYEISSVNSRRELMEKFLKTRRFKKESKKTTQGNQWTEMGREEEHERSIRALDQANEDMNFHEQLLIDDETDLDDSEIDNYDSNDEGLNK